MGHQPTIDKALSIFRSWINVSDLKNPIPPGLRYAIYSLAVKYGGEREYNFLLERYLRKKKVWRQLIVRYKLENISAAERIKCLYALAKTSNTTLINRNLELFFTVGFPLSSTNVIRLSGLKIRLHSYHKFLEVVLRHSPSCGTGFKIIGKFSMKGFLACIIDLHQDTQRVYLNSIPWSPEYVEISLNL